MVNETALKAYFKIGEPSRWSRNPLVGLTDVMTHSLANGLDEGVYLVGCAFDNDFHSPVRQVFNISGYVKPLGQSPGCIAKTDALDNSGKVNQPALAGHFRTSFAS